MTVMNRDALALCLTNGASSIEGRYSAMKELAALAPFPEDVLSVVAKALDDLGAYTEESIGQDPYLDSPEAAPRHYLATAALDALVAHGASALPLVCASRRTFDFAIVRFLEDVGVASLLALPKPVVADTLASLPADRTKAAAILRWLVETTDASDEALLSHPAPRERERAIERTASTIGASRLLKMAVSDPDTRVSCAAAQEAARFICATRAATDDDIACIVTLLEGSAAAAVTSELCGAVGVLGERAKPAARALARLAVRPSSSVDDGFAAAYALSKLGDLPADAIAILEQAKSDGDASVTARVRTALRLPK